MNPNEAIGRWVTLKMGPRAGIRAVVTNVDVRDGKNAQDFYILGYCRDLNRYVKWNAKAIKVGELASTEAQK